MINIIISQIFSYVCVFIYTYILYILYTSKHYYILGIIIANLLYTTYIYINIMYLLKYNISVCDIFIIFSHFQRIIYYSFVFPYVILISDPYKKILKKYKLSQS
jgi:hypothetical protein